MSGPSAGSRAAGSPAVGGAAFVLDPPRCTGCEACRVACCIENQLPMERAWRAVHHVNPEHRPDQPAFHLSLACNHCARPACLEGCPAAAYHRDPATGAVLLDDTHCIGCRYCAWVCPYDAPKFDAARGVMAKCTFCAPRLAEGRAPACAAACPTGALAAETGPGPLPEPAFPGLFAGGLGPALRILGGALPLAPRMDTAAAPADAAGLGEAAPPPKVTLKGEWTLWLFTLAAATLAGLHLGWTLGGPRLLPAWAFLALGGAAAALSTSHLGRPARAWRALSNLRSSWLSREVLAFALFLPLAASAQLLDARPLAWVAAGAGLLLLFAIDRLYQVAERRPPWQPHSAEALPLGLHLGAAAAGAAPLLWTMTLLRAALVVAESWRSGAPAGRLQTSARLAALALPALLSTAAAPVALELVLAAFVAGELLGRGAFYEGLELPSPPRLLAGPAGPLTSGSADRA